MWRVFFCAYQYWWLWTCYPCKETHVQWQVQTEHITLRKQFVEADVLSPTGQLIRQLLPIVINRSHAEHIHLRFEVAADTTHTKNAEDLALSVMAEGRRRVASPFALSCGEQGGIEVPQGTDDEEDGGVGRTVIYSCWHIGDQNWWRALGTGVYVDLVVAGSYISSDSIFPLRIVISVALRHNGYLRNIPLWAKNFSDLGSTSSTSESIMPVKEKLPNVL